MGLPAIVWKALAVAVTTLALVGGFWLYGHHQYAAGHAQAVLEAQAAAAALSEQYRAQEAAAQTDAEAQYAKYRGQVLATQTRAAGSTAALVRLRGQLDTLERSAAANTKAIGRPDGAAGPDFIGVIAECAGRYDEVARYAAGLADKVTGLQDYVRAAQTPGN